MKWLVPKQQKLVQFLQQQIAPPPSGKILRRVLEARLCRVDGTVERFGSATVDKGSVVELAPSWKSLLTPNMFQLETVYEDDDLIAVNKPSGWVSSDAECQKALGPNRHLVHRLDKETTGLLLIAKSHKAKLALSDLFRARFVKKFYHAIVDGVPEQERGECKSQFAKVGAFEGQTVWGSRPSGVPAETHWQKISSGKEASLLSCQPVTGRTHQIRVHCAELGHPILIDRQYAKFYRCKFFATRPLLHAARVRFEHPFTGQLIDLTAPIAADFQNALKDLGLSIS